MSGGGSGSVSKSDSSSSFQEKVWSGQEPYLKNKYGNAEELFDETKGRMDALIPGAIENQQQVFDQSMPNWQNQMQGGAYRDMNLGQNVMRSLNDSMNQPTAMQGINSMIMGGSGNNYADAMRGQYVKDANRSMDNMNANLDARAAGAGMGGSSRHGVAQGIGMRGINDKLQRNMAETGYRTFDKDLDRKLGIAQQADQGTLARQGMMAGMLNKQQGTMNQGLQNGENMQNLGMGQFAPTMMPWEAMEGYDKSIGDPTILGSGSSKGKSRGYSMSGYGGVGA